MKLAANFLGTASILILAYLVLVHFTGFAADIGALGKATAETTKTFQGR